jgi:hypothetical protein
VAGGRVITRDVDKMRYLDGVKAGDRIDITTTGAPFARRFAQGIAWLWMRTTKSCGTGRTRGRTPTCL